MGGGVYHRGCLATTSLWAKSARAAQAAALFASASIRGLRHASKKRGFCPGRVAGEKQAGWVLGLFVEEGFDLGFI
jgi:hypothetical protein